VPIIKKFLLLTLLLIVSGGCAANYYNVPRETYEKKVRVLGIAPILLDAGSEIRHPEKMELLKLVREANRKNEAELVDLLKGNGEYFSVRFLEEDAEQLFSSLGARRERRDDAGIVYNKYFYKPEELKKLIDKHNVDAVMLVTVSGITKMEKVYSNNFMAFLDENYNSLIMTGQILDAEATLLWEYPNFRQRFITFSSLLGLQYPDFEEARANMTELVAVKHKSIPGLGRALKQSETSSVKSSRQVSVLYNKQFAAMTSFLQYFRNPFADKPTTKKPVAAPGAASPDETKPVESLPKTGATAAPPSATPPVKPAPPREFEPVKPAPVKSDEPPLPTPGGVREEPLK
jgi:hypothetical protein